MKDIKQEIIDKIYEVYNRSQHKFGLWPFIEDPKYCEDDWKWFSFLIDKKFGFFEALMSWYILEGMPSTMSKKIKNIQLSVGVLVLLMLKIKNNG